MSAIEQVLGEFIDAWNAGRRPSVDAYLARVDDADRDELAASIGLWLDTAPTPDYDEAARAEIAAGPALARALAAFDASRPAWGLRLHAARTRAGLAVSDLAAKVAAAAGTPGEAARATAYLEQAEHGQLDERRVSQRLVDALADALKTAREDLLPDWAPPAFPASAAPPAPAAAPSVAFRAPGDVDETARQADDAAAADALGQVLHAGGGDELDRLFTGGRHA